MMTQNITIQCVDAATINQTLDNFLYLFIKPVYVYVRVLRRLPQRTKNLTLLSVMKLIQKTHDNGGGQLTKFNY